MQLYGIRAHVSVGGRLELLSVADHAIVGRVPTWSVQVRDRMTPV